MSTNQKKNKKQTPTISHNIDFKQRFILCNTLITKPGQINVTEISIIKNQLTDSIPSSWTLLDTMATESIDENQIVNIWVTTKHTVLIKGVVVIVTSP